MLNIQITLERNTQVGLSPWITSVGKGKERYGSFMSIFVCMCHSEQGPAGSSLLDAGSESAGVGSPHAAPQSPSLKRKKKPEQGTFEVSPYKGAGRVRGKALTAPASLQETFQNTGFTFSADPNAAPSWHAAHSACLCWATQSSQTNKFWKTACGWKMSKHS